MYNTNLSWNPLQEILGSLIDQGLIVMEEGRRKRYEVTETGITVLKYYNEIKKIVTVEDFREKSRKVYNL